MTYRQAKHLVAAVGLNIEDKDLRNEAEAAVIAALEKQIESSPSAYEYKRDKFAFICSCGKEVSPGQKFCDECGQALKWADSGVNQICL